MSDNPEGFEVERARLLFELEQHEAAQPRDSGRDPIHVVLFRLAGMPPGLFAFGLARWSLIARYRRDSAGSADEITDLGPGAMRLAEAVQGADFGPGELAVVGIASGGEWVRWLSPFPPEPVPTWHRADYEAEVDAQTFWPLDAETFCATCGHLDAPGVHNQPECPRRSS
jgi:hypothetical protein